MNKTYNAPQLLPDDFELVGFSGESRFAAEGAVPKKKNVLVQILRKPTIVISLAIIFLIGFMAIVGPMVSGYTYDKQKIQNQNLPPRIPVLEDYGIFDGHTMGYQAGQLVEVNPYEDRGQEETYYWFGTDELGRDIFTRVCVGTRISMYVALVAVFVDFCFGLSYGLISGYFGGKLDLIMQRICEIISGIPTLVIVTLLMLVLKPGLGTITIALSITGWVGMSKIARAQTLKLKQQEFVLAAKTLGAGSFRIMFREILPNILGPVLTASMLHIPNAIFTEAFLAFVGLGVPVPLASLGTLISNSFRMFTIYPYMIVSPLAVLALLMLAFHLLADGLKEIFDPTRADR